MLTRQPLVGDDLHLVLELVKRQDIKKEWKGDERLDRTKLLYIRLLHELAQSVSE